MNRHNASVVIFEDNTHASYQSTHTVDIISTQLQKDTTPPGHKTTILLTTTCRTIYRNT